MLLFLLACGSPQPAEPAPAVPSDPSEPTEAVDEMAMKEAVRMPTDRRIDPIDWEEAFERQRVQVATLPKSAQAPLAEANLPVLLPSDPALLATVVFHGGENWYAATCQGKGYEVLVRGTRIAHSVALDAKTKAAMAPRDEVRITRTEGIVTASFSRYGAAYNLEIECDEGVADAHCASDDVVQDMVRKLGFAGGTE